MIVARPRKKRKQVRALTGNRHLPVHAALMSLLLTLTSVTLIQIAGCPRAEPRFEPTRAAPDIPDIAPEPCDVEPEPAVNSLSAVSETGTAEPDSVEFGKPAANAAESNEPEAAQTPPAAPDANEKPAPRVLFPDKCGEILHTFVNDKGMVDYRRLKRKRSDLEAVLNEFARLDRKDYARWPETDKIALWINAYNMQMMKVIILNYPIDSSRLWRFLGWPPTSIRHIEPTGVLGVKKWDKYKFLVMDEQFTLSEIEERFFRKEFNEPRAFLALTQACLSGPPLRREPYYGYKLDEQLDDQVSKFLANTFLEKPLSLQILREKGQVLLSGLFDPTWYAKDFIPKYGTDKKFKNEKPEIRAVLNFITKHVSTSDATFLETGDYKVGYITFDWRLNDSEEDY